MKFLTLCTAFLLTFSKGDGNMELEIADEYKPIQQNIFDRLVNPEDTKIQRDIKSLFSQYILAAGINAAMNSTNSNQNSAPQQIRTQSPPLFPSFSPVQQQQQQQIQQQQPPQVIYVYVTQPTQSPQPIRTDNSNIKTKKPTKPPKTKKPKPPKATHPNDLQNIVDTQSAQKQPQQQILQQQILQQQIQQQQIQSQPLITQQFQQQEPQGDIESNPPAVAMVTPPSPTRPTTNVSILIPSPNPTVASQTPGLAATPTTAASILPNFTLRPSPSAEHVFSQVDKILDNVSRLNVTGIVDQSLQINSSKPVQNLVTGILNTIFCTPINRLLGRCRG